MKPTSKEIKGRKVQEEVSISLPSYDVEAMTEAIREKPVWAYFDASNTFRAFIGGIADALISEGMSGKGITCAETLGFDVIERVYKPYDSLVLGVTPKADGSTSKKVVGSLTETLKTQAGETRGWKRLKDIFANPGFQIVSFTITEKGYALKGTDRAYFPFIQADIDNGPEDTISAMAVMCSLLYERYKAGRAPLAAVPMDNRPHSGKKLQESVTIMAKKWNRRKYVEDGFITRLSDRGQIPFPWSMIDKITPRPVGPVQAELENAGVEDMTPVITSRSTYIAPLVNAGGSQYLTVEDCSPDGRPALKKVGVCMTDRDMVNKVERMEITVCLNLLHTALAVCGCTLGYTLIANEMEDPLLNKLVHLIGLGERTPVVADPGILSPENSMNEVVDVRIPDPFMPDTPQRIAAGTSQKVEAHYGGIIKACVLKYGGTGRLMVISLAVTDWYRYLLAVDDEGKRFELSTSPMVPELTKTLEGIVVGRPETYRGQLKSILSSANIFETDLHEAGIGEAVEEMFRGEAAGPGAVRAMLRKHLNT